jgi:hypothetical protein
MFVIIITYADQLHSFTHIRDFLVLHDHGIFEPSKIMAGTISVWEKGGGLRLRQCLCGKRCTEGGIYPHIPIDLLHTYLLHSYPCREFWRL